MNMLGNHDVQVDQSGSPAGDQCGGDGVQLKKGPWTTAEDAVLTEYVRKHGEGNWNAVQRNTGLARCGKSCRLRWANHQRPNLKKGSFSPEEERLIVELHAQLGNKWARMAAQLPGRTDNEIKNYWNTRVKRRHRQGLSLYPQEIQAQPHGGGRHQFHHQHPYHHHQQQTPQSSHCHHSHQTPASTPTSSFTFHTTPTTPTTAAHHHLQYFSRSPTPNCLSPSPPPPLSPSSALHFPHQHQSFPTLALFDSSSTTTATNPTNLSTGYTETSSFSPFNVHRAPPILQTPLRFKRFRADTATSSSATPTTNYNTNYNHNHNNIYQSSSFPPPAFSTCLRSPPSFSTPPQPNCNTFSPFSSDPVPFVSNDSWSSINLRTQQFEKDYSSANFPNRSVFALRPELPSSQLFSRLHHRGSSAELSFVDDHEDIDHDQKMSLSGGGSGLLDDLLDETNHHMNSMEDKRDFSGFNNHWSVSVPGSMKPKEETEADQMNNSTAMHEDLSKLFNAINPSMQIPAECYMDMNDIGGEEASNGGRQYSSVISDHDDDNMNLEMQQIASMFRVVVDNTTTCQDSRLMLS